MQWKPPIIENYQVKIPDFYTFIASNLLIEALGITNTVKLSAGKSSLFKGAYQTTLTSTPKIIYFYCNQIDEWAGLKIIILLGCFRVRGRSNIQS